MDQLLLKNHELITHIKNEYDKLLEENKLLKEQLNKTPININTISPNNVKPINTKHEDNKISITTDNKSININSIISNNIKSIHTRQEEFKISDYLTTKYPALSNYKCLRNRLYILKKYKEKILNIINEEDKKKYENYCDLIKRRHKYEKQNK